MCHRSRRGGLLLTQRLALLADQFGWSVDCREAVSQELVRASLLGDDPPEADVRPGRMIEGLGGRYADLGLLGMGGMGEVRRVQDRRLGRFAALKVLRTELVGHGGARARFLAEAEITAQLTHPGVVPVYDIGELLDGRPCYTMKEIAGRTLTELVRAAWGSGPPDDPELRRLVNLYVRVAETVAYAHERGITHRDLKPDNIMVGAFGEVLVLDWGLARVDHLWEEEAVQLSADAWRPATRFGVVSGTPAYMAPEQAAGQIVGPAADAWALGAMLHELLLGRPPYVGDAATILSLVLAGPPPLPDGPEELVAIVAATLRSDPAERLAAGAVAERALAWLDGSTRRARGLELVAEADRLAEAAGVARAEAEARRGAAKEQLAGIPAWAPSGEKVAAWRVEDEGAAREEEAELGRLREMEALHAALSHAPDLPEAHRRLAALYREALVEAESAGDARGAAAAELRLRAHDRGEHAAWLAGTGTLSLVTEPAGARATLYRYVERDRVLVPERIADLGPTPLERLPLERGSWLLVLSAPGRRDVRYPVHIGRGDAWAGSVRLLGEGELGEDEVYVPEGWTWTGCRSPADEELPLRRVWVDAFAIQRFPVTNRAYLAFLDALVAAGQEERALAHCPRTPDVQGRPGTLLYGRDDAGRFVLTPDEDGDVWDPDWPVFFLARPDMDAYAAWLGGQTGHAWRLPHEYEWEKAARGVDLRTFPWGNRFDPSLCLTRESRSPRPLPGRVGEFPADESPYGVRDVAGGTTQLCANRYRLEGPPLTAEGRLLPDLAAPDEYHTARGGAWDFLGRDCQLPKRRLRRGTNRRAQLAFRLVRDLPSLRTDSEKS